LLRAQVLTPVRVGPPEAGGPGAAEPRNGTRGERGGAAVSARTAVTCRALRTFALILLVFVGLWWLAGPGQGLPRADFVLGNGGEPRSLDPALATALLEGRIARGLFEGLVRLDGPELKPVPAAAASWSVEDGGAKVVFRLRPEAKWSDGRGVVAEDFVFGFLRLLDPDVGSRSSAYLFDVRGAEAAFRAALKSGGKPDASAVGLRARDPLTLEIELGRPAPAFLATLALPSLAPLRKDVLAAHPDSWTHAGKLVSNGPYLLEYRSVRDRVRLRRNPHYWAASEVGHETFDILALDSQNTLVNLYFAGEVDWLTDVPTALLRPIAEKHPEHLRLAPMYGTYFFRVNTKIKPLSNRKVRAALDLAIDKAAVVEAFLAGGERPATSLVPPLTGAPPPWRTDRDAARKLMAEGLAEEGLAKLPAFELSCSSVPLHLAVCEALQSQWQEAFGTTVGLARMEPQAFLAAVERGDFALARGSWIGDYPDPLTFLDVFTSTDPNNQTGFAHPRFDAIVKDELRRESDPARRAALAAEAQAILDAERPAIPLFHYSSVNLIRPEIRGFETNALDLHWPHLLRRSPP
jgi:oligopeptide transport system substrate-binding protein